MKKEPFDIRQDTRYAFVLNQTFNDFMKKWPERYDKAVMIETWASILSNSSIKPEHIKKATKYCTDHLKKWPTVYKFKIYCERAFNNESLEAPIITQAEEMAAKLLETVRQGDSGFSENLSAYSDAFLIAALAVHHAHYKKSHQPYSKLSIEEISWKFGMFVKELQSWDDLAEHDQHFWFKKFLKSIELQG